MNERSDIAMKASVGRDIQTPALLLDLVQFDRNARRLRSFIEESSRGLRLRPHMKTVKSVELGRRLTGALGASAITVSTLAEAETYADAGFRDILYAVGIAPAKLDRVAALLRRGVDCQIITDNVDAARAIGEYSKANGVALPVLIEVDCDGHRAGVKPEDRDTLIAIASALGSVRGVMTHGGGSYGSATSDQRETMAAREAESVRRAAATLREAGYQVPVVSAGSTPTALAHADRSGVTEMRAGVFPFFDLVMAGLGVCSYDDIALSVLTTVIGHQCDKGWILCDAGWMALSRDRGTEGQALDCGYGLVCDSEGRILPDLLVSATNQEHGIISMREGSGAPLPDLPVGTQLRILPNHACATAAQHCGYHAIGEEGSAPAWIGRFSGW
jgi:D-serine deaminase-like pyridoxal phosphate-dependent protein